MCDEISSNLSDLIKISLKLRMETRYPMLNESFYARDEVVTVAKELLGKVLVTNVNGVISAGKIVETEAYSYLEKACHAYMNRNTHRTRVLFERGGTAYVYLCYGIHKLFNVVTNGEGVAEAVLVRGVEPLENITVMQQRRALKKPGYQLTSGPGKLTQALGIGMEHNREWLLERRLWIEDHGYKVPDTAIGESPRIGVAYAKEDALLPWRFFIKENQWVSKGFTNYKLE